MDQNIRITKIYELHSLFICLEEQANADGTLTNDKVGVRSHLQPATPLIILSCPNDNPTPRIEEALPLWLVPMLVSFSLNMVPTEQKDDEALVC